MLNDILFILFLMSLISILKFSNYFLMIMISLEYMVILILMIIINYEVVNNNDWMIMYYLIFSVCESVIGLSLLVNMMYLLNNQNIAIKNLL